MVAKPGERWLVALSGGKDSYGLLAVLFPETDKALRSNRSGALRKMVLAGLVGTDARVAAEEPVSPAFLFAVLLWPAYCRSLAQLEGQGMHAAEAQRRAADRVTLHLTQVVALPRRFSLPMQEIWLLQPRFAQRRRTGRFLAHPRFRAAYDFLKLRERASPAHAADVAYWTEQQAGVSPHAPGMEEGDEGGEEQPRSPRRRRRRS